MSRRPRIADYDYDSQFVFDQDGPSDDQLRHRRAEPNDVCIELDERYTGSEVPRQNHPHTLPRAIIDQLPSRNKFEVFGLENKTSRRRNVASKYGTLRSRVPPAMINKLNEQEVLTLFNRENELDSGDMETKEQKQSATLRELHYALTWKRNVKKQLDAASSRRKPKKLGCWKQIKYSMSMKWQKFKTETKEALFTLELWKKPLRSIEGNFGSSVASYFYLLRSLLRLNILSCIILFIFIMVPQLLLHHIPDAQFSELPCNNSRNLTTLPMRPPSFTVWTLLTGGDWFEHTILYYGGYSSVILNIIDDVYYSIPLAYLLTISGNMVIVLILMAYALARSFKRRYMFMKGLKTNLFFNKTFCGWDFAIMNAKTANQQRESLHSELKEHLAQLNKPKIIHTIKTRIVSLCRFLFFHLLAVGILAATGAIIYYLLERDSLRTDIKVLGQLALSLTVVLITLIVPAILAFMVVYEGYSSRHTELWVTMIRSLILICVILGILLMTWVPADMSAIIKFGEIGNSTVDAVTTTTLVPNTTLDVVSVVEYSSKRDCWETQVGKEIYRLVLMDFLVCGVLNFFAFWVKSIAVKHNFKYFGTTEFNVAWNTWILLYNQMLFWIGSLFSPLLTVIMVIKMVIIFYIKQYSVKLHSQPPQSSKRQANAQTIFFSATLLALILSMLGLGFIIIYVHPSVACGPFRAVQYPYNIVLCVTASFRRHEQTVGEVFAFITKPGCVSLFVVFMCCAAYYSRAITAAALEMVKLIQHQVAMEGKDKSFLINRLSPILKAQQNTSFDESIRSPTSPNRTSGIVETSNFDVHSDEPPSDYNLRSARNSRSSNDSSRRFEFSRKLATPLQHKNFGENSPLSSNRRRQMSVPTDSDLDRSDIEINPYRSNDSLPAYPYVNQAFRGDSPFKSRTPDKSSPYRESGSPLPGVNHQPPFRNFGKIKEKTKSEENIKSTDKKRYNR